MRLDKITIGPRVRKDMGDIDALAASIREVGLLQPVAVRADGRLVGGERRLRAVELLGWQEIPVHVCQNLEDEEWCLKAEREENVCRKDFLPSEAVALGMALEEVERAAAKERQATAGPS